jgi:hypothetical protein
MITDAFLDLVEGLIRAVLALFPRWSPDVSWLAPVNVFLPVDTLSLVLGVMWGFVGAGLVVWGVMKVANLLRGSGA